MQQVLVFSQNECFLDQASSVLRRSAEIEQTSTSNGLHCLKQLPELGKDDLLVLDCTSEGESLSDIQLFRAANEKLNILLVLNNIQNPEISLCEENANIAIGIEYLDPLLLTAARIAPSIPLFKFFKSGSNIEASVSPRDSIKANALRYKLTNRQIELLLESLEGKTYKEIGHKFSIKEGTVKEHMRNICEKLGVDNRRMILSKLALS